MDIDEFPEIESAVVAESNEGDSEDESEEDDEVPDSDSGYGFMTGHYNVQVTDIVVNEDDKSFLPLED